MKRKKNSNLQPIRPFYRFDRTPRLTDPEGCRQLLAQCYRLFLKDQLQERKINVAIRVTPVLLQCIEKGKTNERLERLEQQILTEQQNDIAPANQGTGEDFGD